MLTFSCPDAELAVAGTHYLTAPRNAAQSIKPQVRNTQVHNVPQPSRS